MNALPHPQTLRCFVTIARVGSISGAASVLHLSQPAVSLQLKQLENATGLHLFDRTPHGLTITRVGRALLSEAESALGALTSFNRTALSLHTSVREVLRVGTILDPEFTRLGAFLKEFVEAAPRIETQLRHGMSDDALDQVLRRELDVGFYLDHPDHPDPVPVGGGAAGRRATAVQWQPLKQFAYRVVAPPGWASKVRGKDWKALARLPWLATPLASAHRRLLATVFGPLGVEPERVAMTDQEPTMLELLESGVGLSLVRDTLADLEAPRRGLVVADRVSIPCVLGFISLRARATEPAIAQAWAAIGRTWGPLSRSRQRSVADARAAARHAGVPSATRSSSAAR